MSTGKSRVLWRRFVKRQKIEMRLLTLIYSSTQLQSLRRLPHLLAMPATIDATTRIVRLLAARFDFDADEAGAFLVAAGKPATARTVRTDRSADFLSELAVAESKDAAKSVAKPKKPPLTAEEKAAKKAAAEAKAAAKAAKPKRAATGYLLFCDALRPDVVAAQLSELEKGEKLAPTATVVELALQWQALPQSEKDEWKAKAKAAAAAAKASSGSDSE